MCLLPTFAFGNEPLINCLNAENGDSYKLTYTDNEITLTSSDFQDVIQVNHPKINDRFLIATSIEGFSGILVEEKITGDWLMRIFSLDTEEMTIEFGSLNSLDKSYGLYWKLKCFEVVN